MTEEFDAETQKRHRLWAEIWNLWYRGFYAEKASEFMLTRWLAIDHFSRIVVALFASGSALTGWSLWSSEAGKKWWAVLAGIAMITSILAGALSVQDRVKRFAETKTTFTRLRIRLEGLLAQMRIDPEFKVQPVQDSFLKSQDSYGESFQTYPHDIFFRRIDEERVQAALNQSIEHVRQNPHAGPTS